MSGLEALAALSIACNIFQVISFAHETVELCKRVYKVGKIEPGLNEKAVCLADVSERLLPDHPGVLGKEDAELVDLARKCQSYSRDLQEEIAFLQGSARGKARFADALRVAAKTQWRKRRLDRVLGDLERARRLMETTLLVKTCNKTDILQIDLDILTTDMRFFVQQYSRGHTSTLDLISTEGSTTRRYVSQEAQQTQLYIKKEVMDSSRATTAHVEQVASSSVSAIAVALRKMELNGAETQDSVRLRRSLKFSGMNNRRNQVHRAHEKTFRWVFEDGDKDEDDEDSEDEDEDEDDADENGAPNPVWDNFPDWLQSEGSVYWISGKPGSGKTTLVNYILSHQQFRATLDSWNPDTIVLSHFFWRPGPSLMQRSIKGLFCSLNHQLLEHDNNLCNVLIHAFPRWKAKTEDADWNVDELERLFREANAILKRPLCLVLDGLDEIDPEEGVDELLAVVKRLQKIPRTKLCLSSRPEPPFRRYMSRFPNLRLQDLTAPDIRNYVLANLRRPHRSRNYVDYDGIERREWELVVMSICHRAAGVFLWAALTVKDVNRGVDNGELVEVLLRRVNLLPSKLNDLYNDMWTRFNGENAVHRQEAARYLKAVIAFQASGAVERLSYDNYHPYSPNKSPNLFHVMLISEHKIFQNFKTTAQLPSAVQLEKVCRDVEQNLDSRCAGFLEVCHVSNVEDVKRPEWPTVLPSLRKEVTFVHRTAFDFFTDTEQGKNILDHDHTPLPAVKSQVLMSILAVYCLFPPEPRPPGKHILVDFLRRIHPMEGWSSGTPESLKEANKVASRDWYDTMQLCERLHASGKMGQRTPESAPGHFLAVAAGCVLVDFVADAVSTRDLSTDEMSNILSCLCNEEPYRRRDCGWDIGDKMKRECLITMLLDRGANPNWRGPRSNLGGTSYRIGGPFVVMSQFSAYILAAMNILFRERPATWPSDDGRLGHITDMTRILLEGGACLQDSIRIFVGRRDGRNGNHFQLLKSIMMAYEEHEMYHPGRLSSDRRYTGLIVSLPLLSLIKFYLNHAKFGHLLFGGSGIWIDHEDSGTEDSVTEHPGTESCGAEDPGPLELLEGLQITLGLPKEHVTLIDEFEAEPEDYFAQNVKVLGLTEHGIDGEFFHVSRADSNRLVQVTLTNHQFMFGLLRRREYESRCRTVEGNSLYVSQVIEEISARVTGDRSQRAGSCDDILREQGDLMWRT